MLFRDRKAQVTLFVIIAIVAVAVVGMFAMLRTGIIKTPMSTEDAKVLLASQTEPLRDYASDCIKRTANTYFQKSMLQGGYYYSDNLDQIYFSDSSKIIVAYKSPDGTYNNILPSLENICGTNFDNFMELEGYEMLDDCVKDFSTFKKYMNVESSEDRKIAAVCNDEDITIKAEWPVTISRADASSVISQKNTKLIIPLKRMWTFSNDIVNDEVGGKDFIGTEIEEYMWAHKYGIKTMLLESAAYPTHEQTLYFISSKPYRAGEQESKFYFAVDKSERTSEEII